jgi:hypothetical protein
MTGEFVALRAARRLALATLLVMGLTFLMGTHPIYGQEEPPPCGPANDGELWIDPETEVVYQCQYVEGFGWGWHAAPYPDYPNSSAYKFTYNDGFAVYQGVITSGDNGIYGRAQIWTQKPQGTFVDRPPNNIQITELTLYKWIPSTQQAHECLSVGPKFNSSTSHYMSAQIFPDPYTPPCGNGYYFAAASAYAWWGGAWRGSGFYTPNAVHWCAPGTTLHEHKENPVVPLPEDLPVTDPPATV